MLQVSGRAAWKLIVVARRDFLPRLRNEGQVIADCKAQPSGPASLAVLTMTMKGKVHSATGGLSLPSAWAQVSLLF